MVERIKALKHIILLYYLIIGFVILLFRSYAQMDLSLDNTITIILLVYFILFPVVMIYTLRYALHIFLFSLAFITGFYGFYYYSVDNHSISNALYFTFRLYLLDLADVFTHDGSSPIRYPLLLEIARWTAASYTITTIFIAMYRNLEKRIALFIAQTFGNHHIIFSYNEKSHYLIQDLRAKKERVIVVDGKFTPEIQSMLEEMKVIVIQAAKSDSNVFQQCGVKKAKSISLFHSEDRESLFVLMNLEKYARSKNLTFNFDKVIIQLEDNRYKMELLSFLERVEHFSFPVEVINVHQEVARNFWKNHRNIFQTTEDLHFLFVGYQTFGQQLVQSAEESYRESKTNQSMTITILDGFPRAEQLNHIEKIPFKVREDSLEDVIEKHPQNFSHIFICLTEDYVDLMEGIELSETFPKTPIFMSFSDESIEQTFLISTTKTKKTLYSTGTIEEVLTKKYLGI